MTKRPTEYITPEKALQYLEHNACNRKPKLRVIRQISYDISRNKWTNTLLPIVFDTNGHLIDGQNRLIAISQAKPGLKFECVVERNADPKIKYKIDKGASRSAADDLAMSGMSADTARIAAVMKKFIKISSWMSIDVDSYIENLGFYDAEAFVTLCLKELSKAEKAIDICYAGGPICSPPSLFAGLFVLCAKRNGKFAEKFFDKFVNGGGIKTNHPINKLRNLLMKNFSKRDHSKHFSSKKKAALFIKCYNSVMDGSELEKLSYKDKEVFPQISDRRHPVVKL